MIFMHIDEPDTKAFEEALRVADALQATGVKSVKRPNKHGRLQTLFKREDEGIMFITFIQESVRQAFIEYATQAGMPIIAEFEKDIKNDRRS